MRDGPPSGSPSEPDVDLLDAALGGPDMAGAAWERFAGRVDIRTLEAPSAVLLPTVYHNLRRYSPRVIMTPKLKGIARHTFSRNLMRMRETARIAGDLTGTGVEPSLVDDAVLTGACYPSPGARGIGPVSLCVPVSQSAGALDRLAAEGWEIVTDKRVKTLDLQRRLLHRPGDRLRIWMEWYESVDKLADWCAFFGTRSIWDGPVFPGVDLQGASASHQLARQMLVHRRKPFPSRLAWICDTHRVLARQWGDTWSRLEDFERRLEALNHKALRREAVAGGEGRQSPLSPL